MEYIPFPNKKYNIIYADPPWDVMRGPGWNSNGISRPLAYPTMSLNEIKSLPVDTIADTNAHLYLWTINKYLYEAYNVAKTWGFKPTCLLTYCKKPHGLGLGGAFVQTTEHLLFCRKGRLKTYKRVNTTWFEQPRLVHSKKPDFFRNLIVEVSGDIPRIELFARAKYPGWDVWGNEV